MLEIIIDQNEDDTFIVSFPDVRELDTAYLEFERDVDAHAEAEAVKAELEDLGYDVTIVWYCYKPGWA